LNNEVRIVLFDDKHIAAVAAEIRRALSEADTAAANWDVREAELDESELVDYYIDRAFTQALVLLELCNAPKTYARVKQLYAEAKNDLGKTAFSVNTAEIYLVWASALRNYIDVLVAQTASPYSTETPVRRVQRLLQRVVTVAAQLRAPYQNRKGFEIRDEHDLQHLLNAILRTEFDDVRREEWGPSHAGSSARVDFLVADHGVILEAKMTRAGLADKRLGEQLTLDLAHYQKRSECDALVFFVYDPARQLKNPAGLRKDLVAAAKNLRLFVEITP